MDLEKILPKDGPPINEVNKYIEKYKNDLIVIKYGGNVLIDRNVFNNFITDLSVLNKLGLATVVIHGHTSISPNLWPPNCALPPSGCCVTKLYGPVDLA